MSEEISAEVKPTKSIRISDVDFVTAYQACDNRQEVADITGLLPGSVSVRSGELRKRGVNLKRFVRKGNTGQRTDVSGLNDLIGELSPQTEEE
jgi:hypothetical protein